MIEPLEALITNRVASIGDSGRAVTQMKNFSLRQTSTTPRQDASHENTCPHHVCPLLHPWRQTREQYVVRCGGNAITLARLLAVDLKAPDRAELHVAVLAREALLMRDLLARVVDDPLVLRNAFGGEHSPTVQLRATTCDHGLPFRSAHYAITPPPGLREGAAGAIRRGASVGTVGEPFARSRSFWYSVESADVVRWRQGAEWKASSGRGAGFWRAISRTSQSRLRASAR